MDKGLELLIDKTKDWKEMCYRRACSHYAFVNGLDTVEHSYSDICFARLHSSYGIKAAKLFINQHLVNNRWTKDEEAGERILNNIKRIVERYPFAFLNADGDWLNEGLSLNCDMSHNQVFFFMVMIRCTWEYEKRGYNQTAAKFEEMGFDLQQSFILAHYFSYKEENNNFFYEGNGCGHHGFYSCYGLQEKCLDIELYKLYSDVSCKTRANNFQLFEVQKGKLGRNIDIGKYGKQHGQGWDELTTLSMEDFEKMIQSEFPGARNA